MKVFFKIMLLSLMLNSCENCANNNAKIVTDFDGNQSEEVAEHSVVSSMKSRLKTKLNRLKNLENNYQIVKFGELPLEQSILYLGTQRIAEFSVELQGVEGIRSEEFHEHFISAKYGYVKGTRDLGENIFARAKIEELIFRSDEYAMNLAKLISQIKEMGRAWEDIDKAPNSIFSEGNKVYYISSGGWYMRPFYQE